MAEEYRTQKRLNGLLTARSYPISMQDYGQATIVLHVVYRHNGEIISAV